MYVFSINQWAWSWEPPTGSKKVLRDGWTHCMFWSFHVFCWHKQINNRRILQYLCVSYFLCLSLTHQFSPSSPSRSFVRSLPRRLQKAVSITCSFLQGTFSVSLCSSLVSESLQWRILFSWPHQTALPPAGTQPYVGDGGGYFGGYIWSSRGRCKPEVRLPVCNDQERTGRCS